MGIEAVVVSSDEYERMMMEKAKTWGVPVVALYEPIIMPGGEIPAALVGGSAGAAP